MTDAAVYVRTPVDPATLLAPPEGVFEELAGVSRFAEAFGFQVTARHHDVGIEPLPGPRSAFVRMLDDLAGGVIEYVLVASRASLSPLPEAQRAMARMIADNGGVLVLADSAPALGITRRPASD